MTWKLLYRWNNPSEKSVRFTIMMAKAEKDGNLRVSVKNLESSKFSMTLLCLWSSRKNKCPSNQFFSGILFSWTSAILSHFSSVNLNWFKAVPSFQGYVNLYFFLRRNTFSQVATQILAKFIIAVMGRVLFFFPPNFIQAMCILLEDTCRDYWTANGASANSSLEIQ